jgi:hypothetical protein
MNKKINKLFLDEINLHDCKIYSLGYNEKNNQFLLDVDYISSEWVLEQNGYYSFTIKQAIFAFENAWDININISMDNVLIIDDVIISNPHNPKNVACFSENTLEYDWKIELFQGEITFKSIGFSIYPSSRNITPEPDKK